MTAKRVTANKIKFKYIQGREYLLFYIIMCIVYLLLVALSVLFSINAQEESVLKLKFKSEQAFNSIYLLMGESYSRAIDAMGEQNVYAVGIYSASGQRYQGLGDAPAVLPVEKLSEMLEAGEDLTAGMYIVHDKEKTVDYYRLSRLNMPFEPGSFNEERDLPEIILVSSDAAVYLKEIRALRLTSAACVILLTVMFLIILNVSMSNMSYRKKIEKDENLVKLGAAVRTLTHEIKNPLSAISIQTGLLHKILPDEFSQDIDMIDHEVLRITSLTDRVSEFLKNPVGKPVEMELISFIREIGNLFGQNIRYDFEDILSVYVMFDADRARSVFENLIKNAFESCEGRNPEVEVTIRRKKSRVLVSVNDRGDGISETARKQLFDPFFTTKIHGSGIGLSISHQFVTAAGGKLEIAGRDGGGTSVTVELPFNSISTGGRK